ncbi:MULTISPECIES: hypothetical protein [unclassified Streptomyces]|uniref:hypothetical protein n=1 Tax=unclassified Streptomyces TaxID=2593676 RepID=UPI0004BF3AE1|nr:MULTISPECIES: hypothetical protein [unclassified Streptomyces]
MRPADSGDSTACWFLLLHVAGIGERAETAQAFLRDVLEKCTRQALTEARVRPQEFRMQARDAGLGVRVSMDVRGAGLLRDFVRSLDDHLAGHNDRCRGDHRLSVRLGLHMGTIAPGAEHWSTRAVSHLVRLMELTPTGPASDPPTLVLVLSDVFHKLVVMAADPGIRPTDYAPFEVPAGADGGPCESWVSVAGRAGPPSWAPAAPVDTPEAEWPRTGAAGPAGEPGAQAVPGISGPLLHPNLRLGEGGQATVYPVVRDVPGLSGPLAYKEYRPGVLRDPEVLQNMVGFFRALARDSPDEHAFLDSRLAWPLMVGRRLGVPSGVLMRQASADYVLRSPALHDRPRSLDLLLNPDAYLRRIGLEVGDELRLLLLKDLVGIVATLHRHGITVGDLSPKNILFRVDVWPSCLLIDCDSMRLRGRDALDQVETPGWAAPEPRKATRASDVYKLGLMALRLFNRDQESTDSGPLSGRSAELAWMAERSLADRPRHRPPLSEWLPKLERAAGEGKSDTTWIDVDEV